MGTPAQREYKPTPHQSIKAKQMIRVLNYIGECTTPKNISYQEVAVFTNEVLPLGGEFKWEYNNKKYTLTYHIGNRGWVDVEHQYAFLYDKFTFIWSHALMDWIAFDNYKETIDEVTKA